MTQPPEQQPTQRAPHSQPPQQAQPPTPPGPESPQPPPSSPYGGQQWNAAPPPGPNPYPAAGGGGYGGSYGGYGGTPSPYQPKKGGSGKTIALIVGIVGFVVLLFCGGFIGLLVWAANNVEDGLGEFDPNRTGGRDNPITVAEGESFEIDGVEYAAGWRVRPPTGEYDTAFTIADLRGENDREDESSEHVYLTFTFVGADDVEVGEIDCRSDGGISYGRSEVLECSGYDVGLDYDHIEVSAL